MLIAMGRVLEAERDLALLERLVRSAG